MKIMITILSLLTISSSAFADVCGIVTKEQGEMTLSFLTKGAKITRSFADQSRMVVREVKMVKSIAMDGEDYYDLTVNGEPIDPGHTNIVINKNVSLNLGRLVGCSSSDSDLDMIIPTPMK